jgi:RING finger protein 170
MKLLQLMILAVVYLLIPYDIVPESAVGLLGLADDLVIIVVVLLYVANSTHKLVVERARRRVEAQS